MKKLLLCVALFFLLVLGTGDASIEKSWMRVNQLGYLPGSLKIAVFVSKENAGSPRSNSGMYSPTR